jgi:predicted acetyltransferase
MEMKITKGWSMKPAVLNEIDRIWQKEFPRNDSVLPKNRRNFSEDAFFVLYDENKILSTGRLRPNSIKFRGKNYKIQGIADIVSVIKGKGYGKKIMRTMHKYLNGTGEIGIGFCMRENSSFYRKSGLKIAANLAQRFVYKNSKGKFVRGSTDNDVIYFEKGRNLVNDIIKHPKEKVLIPKYPW